VYPYHPFGYNFNGGKLIAFPNVLSRGILQYLYDYYSNRKVIKDGVEENSICPFPLSFITTSLYGRGVMYNKLGIRCKDLPGDYPVISQYDKNKKIVGLEYLGEPRGIL